MTRFSIAPAALAAASLLIILPHGQAQARVACDGNYQIVQGRPLATPLCRERNLALVARSFGIRVSAESIRQNESVKADVCRTIGHDNRVREVCLPYRNEGGSRGRF